MPNEGGAARRLLNDDTVDGMDAGRWLDIFAALGDEDVPSRLLWRASRFAMLARREATTGWVTNVGTAIAGARRTEGAWAWTGSMAARAYGSARDTTPALLTAYAEDPETFLVRLGATRCRPACRSSPLAVYRGDDVVFAGLWSTTAGDWSVAPLQAAIDCYGGIGRVPEDADVLLEQMGLIDAAADRPQKHGVGSNQHAKRPGRSVAPPPEPNIAPLELGAAAYVQAG